MFITWRKHLELPWLNNSVNDANPLSGIITDKMIHNLQKEDNGSLINVVVWLLERAGEGNRIVLMTRCLFQDYKSHQAVTFWSENCQRIQVCFWFMTRMVIVSLSKRSSMKPRGRPEGAWLLSPSSGPATHHFNHTIMPHLHLCFACTLSFLKQFHWDRFLSFHLVFSHVNSI